MVVVVADDDRVYDLQQPHERVALLCVLKLSSQRIDLLEHLFNYH